MSRFLFSLFCNEVGAFPPKMGGVHVQAPDGAVTAKFKRSC